MGVPPDDLTANPNLSALEQLEAQVAQATEQTTEATEESSEEEILQSDGPILMASEVTTESDLVTD